MQNEIILFSCKEMHLVLIFCYIRRFDQCSCFCILKQICKKKVYFHYSHFL